MPRDAKLLELRRKTDRDLLILVERELHRGLTLAELAASKQSPLHARAETAYATVSLLLPKIENLSQDERRRLEGMIKDLRLGLDGVPSFRDLPAPDSRSGKHAAWALRL